MKSTTEIVQAIVEDGLASTNEELENQFDCRERCFESQWFSLGWN